MIVFLAGMQRSGSTFAFNIARDVLTKRGKLHQQAAFDIPAELAAAGPCDHLLLKSHDMDELGINLARTGAIRVICTIRRPEDAVASFMETFGLPEADSIILIKAWLALYEKIRDVALTLDYDFLDRHPIRAAHTIGRFLSPDVGWREARTIARRHAKHAVKAMADHLDRTAPGVQDLGYSYYDQTTFFHRKHVSSLTSVAAEQRLPPDQAARIRQAFADYQPNR
ncbi:MULTISPECIES: hypothetical protein [Acidiphilium]|uniref:Sulfotransferase family protein n=1 Tax=Acidiphilium rubrum TaxID=526 RepID=A0A8G2FGT0_ACIRU|nr:MULTISPECIES: hypothetical protein [Acidiphilium]MBW4034830.1 hypothetical protein [Pseudomonadota bacterium]SIQ90699.1 hypothetical protein SAMN05421828_11195 [Acidiphilium rubrum]